MQAFCGDVHLGVAGNVNVTVGPVGRNAMASLCVGQRGCAMVYSYSCSRGAFVGASIDGTVTHTRSNANLAFYGRPLTAKDLLLGCAVEAPPAARTLYTALNSLMNSFGYSQLPHWAQAVQHSVDARTVMPLDATYSVDDFSVPEKPPLDASAAGDEATAAPAIVPTDNLRADSAPLRISGSHHWPCLHMSPLASVGAPVLTGVMPSAPALPEIDEGNAPEIDSVQDRSLSVPPRSDAASEISDEVPLSLFDDDS